MRFATRCIRSTPTDMLPILNGIKPTNIRRKSNIVKLNERTLKDQTHLLHTDSRYYQTTQRLASQVTLTTKFKQIKIADTNQVADTNRSKLPILSGI